MELRKELLPPVLDKTLLARLAQLADRLDGGDPDESADLVEEFNRLADNEFEVRHFHGIFGAMSCVEWARDVLTRRSVKRAPNVTEAELVEVVRRAMPASGYEDFGTYMLILDANVAMPGASNLIFHPPQWNAREPTSRWSPTPEEIVKLVLAYKVHPLP